jgi:peptide/nickel transport system substrate-binding protein
MIRGARVLKGPRYNGGRLRKRLALLIVLVLSLSACHKQVDSGKPISIHISVPYELDSLDPHLHDTISDYVIACHFYEPLVRITPTMSIEPVLAESWENPDATTWVFHLRAAAKFHSGKILTADDVVYSFKRLLGNPGLGIKSYLANVTGVEADDSRTVRIRTSRPVSILLNRLSFVLIVPSGAQEKDLSRTVNGTGPFRFSSREGDRSISMIRNEDYWGPKPVLRDVTFYLGRSPDHAMRDLLTRRSQFVQCNTKRLERLKESLTEYTILHRDNLFMKYLGFDVSRDDAPGAGIHPNPFKNPDVRRAFSLAIDLKKLVEQLPTPATPASQPVPPFIFGYNPDIPAPVFDPDQARALLRRAGIEQWRVTLDTRQLFKEAAEIVRSQLGAVGVQLDLNLLSDHDFFETMRLGRSSLFLSRLGCPTGDASMTLGLGMHSPDPSQNYGGNNWGGYSNPSIDRAIEESDEIPEVDRRRHKLEAILATVTDDLVWVPLYFDQDTYVLHHDFSWEPRTDSYIFASEIQWQKQK